MKKLGLAITIFLLLFSSSRVFAQERLLRMDVEVRVSKDALLTVTERIVYETLWETPRDVRRGLIRNIPVARGDEKNFAMSTFKMLSATLDGKPVPYELKRVGRDVEIHLGSDRYLREGQHEYVLIYSMTDQLLFHKDGDELYWNVTGNKWAFPIDNATFRITLPDGATVREQDAWTGSKGSRGKDWTLSPEKIFETTCTLKPGEGFTVSVTWNKGFVSPPVRNLLDGQGRTIFALCVLLVIVGHFVIWWIWGRDPRRGVVTPLFGPPYGLEAAYIGYAKTLTFDTNLLLSDLIQLAVQGQIVMEPNEKYLKVEKAVAVWGIEVSPAHRKLLDRIFEGGSNSVLLGGEAKDNVLSASFLAERLDFFYETVDRKNSSRPILVNRNWMLRILGLLLFLPMIQAMYAMESPFALDIRSFGQLWFGIVLIPGAMLWLVYTLFREIARSFGKAKRRRKFNDSLVRLAGLLVLFALYLGFPRYSPGEIVLLIGQSALYFNAYFAQDPLFVGGLWAGLFAALILSPLIPARTRAGRRLLDQVEGFEMYLETAERDRFAMLYPTYKDAFPEMTAGLYERLLPYAFALDVVDAWTEAFTPLLTRVNYLPCWYRGDFSVRSFPESLHKSGSVMNPPKSSGGSGRGGGGFSGGGFGGGGGRGR